MTPAAAVLDTPVRRPGTNVAAVLAEALRFHRLGSVDLAAAAYERVLDQDPLNVTALSNLGVIRAASGRYDDATALYERALALAPSDGDLLTNLGNLHTVTGDFQRAEVRYRAAVALLPRNGATRLNLGGLLARDGRFIEAAEQYRAALAAEPANATAHTRLGALLIAQGQLSEAIAMLSRAVALAPNDAHTRCLLGEAYAAAGAGADAEAHYRAATQLAPDEPEAWHRLANHLVAIGRPDVAIEAFAVAAECGGGAPVLRDYGGLLTVLGRDDEALTVLDRARALDPDDTQTALHLGGLHFKYKRIEPAEQCFTDVVRLAPGLYEGRFNLALTLDYSGRRDKAERIWRDLTVADPERKEASIALGNLLRVRGHLAEARAYAAQAQAIDPHSVDAFSLLANIAHDLHEEAEALEWADLGLAIDPGAVQLLKVKAVTLSMLGRHADAMVTAQRAMHSNTSDDAGVALVLASTYERAGLREKALSVFEFVRSIDPGNSYAVARSIEMKLALCNWGDYDGFIAGVVRHVTDAIAADRPHGVDIQDMHNLPVPYEFTARAARHSARAVMKQNESQGIRCSFDFTGRIAAWGTEPKRRIRVGYALPYTFLHSFPQLFKNVIDRHDRTRFEVFGYSARASAGSDFERTYRASFEHFRDVNAMGPEQAAQAICADGVDVLIDVSGHTSINCQPFVALRPAPVQAHMLGYSITVGPYIDYLITDRVFMPPHLAVHNAEHTVYLPHTSMAPNPALIAPEPQSRAAEGLPEDGIVFTNFNQPFKFEPTMFRVWMRILHRVPKSVLWLGRWSPETCENLKRAALELGVDPARLVFADIRPHATHLARLALADVALDTRHHGGGATTMDAFWAGVPVINCAGATPASRNGSSFALALGMPELTTTTIDAYEELAVALAEDPARRAAIRAKIQANRLTQPLFDGDRYVRNLERAIEMMWAARVAGRLTDIDVPDTVTAP